MRVKFITDIFQNRSAWVTSRKSTGQKGRLISSPGDSHASPIVLQENVEQVQMSGICGGSVLEPYAQYDPDTHSLRTFQICLVLNEGDSLTGPLVTWQRQGMMRGGKLFRRAPLVRHTHGSGCGLLPTPTKSDGTSPLKQTLRKEETWETISSLTGKIVAMQLGLTGKQNLSPKNWVVNPLLIERMMGYRDGWTETQGLETQSSPKWHL